MRLRNAFKNSVFEASKLVSTKTLVLKHYYRRPGLISVKGSKRLPSFDTKTQHRGCWGKGGSGAWPGAGGLKHIALLVNHPVIGLLAHPS